MIHGRQLYIQRIADSKIILFNISMTSIILSTLFVDIKNGSTCFTSLLKIAAPWLLYIKQHIGKYNVFCCFVMFYIVYVFG